MIVRPYPYPFRAMLAVCSDLDETPDAAAYFGMSRFLNQEVGLEVGNTLYFKMPADQFSWYNCSDADRDQLAALIRSGHIDCLHSFGDLVTSRQEVVEAWRELLARDCRIEVWIDHAAAKSNFDADIMFGEGAIPEANCYHADLSLQNGIRYVWKGRVTSVIAKEASLSLGGIFRSEYPLRSAVTIAKEVSKILLGALGSIKYASHAQRGLLRTTTLLSGHPVREFIRSNPSFGGVSHNETGDGISEVLTEKVLDQLVKKSGATIVYTHLGKTRDGQVIPEKSAAAFRRLAEYQRGGKILVATTRRLLGYLDAKSGCRFKCKEEGSRLTIQIETSLAGKDLEGLTFYIPDAITEVTANFTGGRTISLKVNARDETGRKSASIPWLALRYPG